MGVCFWVQGIIETFSGYGLMEILGLRRFEIFEVFLNSVCSPGACTDTILWVIGILSFPSGAVILDHLTSEKAKCMSSLWKTLDGRISGQTTKQ